MNESNEAMRVCDRIMTPDGAWQKISRWTSSSTIECADGKLLEEKLNDISGITSDLNCTDEKIAASAKSANTLYKNAAALSVRVDQCFQNVSSGKALLASAITDKGITTAQDATFQQMAANIRGLITMSSNPNVLFDISSWTAPRDCVAVMSWAVKWSGNDDYEATAVTTLSGVRTWTSKWGNTHDSHWHDYSMSGNCTWEAVAGTTYTLSFDAHPGSHGGILTWGWNSRTWIV